MKIKLLCGLAAFLAASTLWADECITGTGDPSDVTLITVHGFSVDNSHCGFGEHCPDGVVLGANSAFLAEQEVRQLCAVGHNAFKNPFTAGEPSGTLRTLAMLNEHCRRDQGETCRLAGVSMGGLITSGTLSLYNYPVGGHSPYNIVYSTQIVSAEGGSEYANLGDGIFSFPILGAVIGWVVDFFADLNGGGVQSLSTHYARGAFDHNASHGTQLYHVVGNQGLEDNILTWAVNWILPGQDDMVVAFHSACGYRQTGAFDRCMGQEIQTGFWWWQRTYVTPYEAHHMYQDYGVHGEPFGHDSRREHLETPTN